MPKPVSPASFGPATRITTGISGLDTLLDGGLFVGNMDMVTGKPGARKTGAASHPEHVSSFFSVLSRELRRRGGAGLVTEESRELYIRQLQMPVAELTRLLAVLKTRDSAHDPGLYQFVIESNGLRIGKRLSAHPGMGIHGTPSSAPARALRSKPMRGAGGNA